MARSRGGPVGWLGLRWPAGVMAGVLLGVLVRSFVPTQSDASHPYDPHRHLGSINSYDADTFCVWLEEDAQGQVLSSMDYGAAAARIARTLMVDSPNQDWDRLDGSLKGNNLAFATDSSTPCDEAPFRGDIEIEYWVRDDTSGWPCYGWSCAWLSHPYNDPISGHEEFRYGYVRFKTAHINQSDPGPGQDKPWWHVINHETGHILGLADGDGTCPDPASVMHSIAYGCDVNAEWPSAQDRASVEALIPAPPPSGGGNTCGRGAFVSSC